MTPAGRGRLRVSQAKLAANRRNAARSTGPKSPAGKQAAARNALKHGLSVLVRADPGFSARVEALSYRIAGEGAEAPRLALVRRVAEAQAGLERVRAARFALLARGAGGGRRGLPEAEQRRSASAAEGRSAGGEEAIGRDGVAPGADAGPGYPEEPAPAIAAAGEITRRLALLDRYEARALARRKSAIKALDALSSRVE